MVRSRPTVLAENCPLAALSSATIRKHALADHVNGKLGGIALTGRFFSDDAQSYHAIFRHETIMLSGIEERSEDGCSREGKFQYISE
jgi:hypothetical protein